MLPYTAAATFQIQFQVRRFFRRAEQEEKEIFSFDRNLETHPLSQERESELRTKSYS